MSTTIPFSVLLLDNQVDGSSNSLSFFHPFLLSSFIRAVDIDLLVDHLFLVLLVQLRCFLGPRLKGSLDKEL
eukprot:9033777-Heterocapsa_arctica.AAC.1